MKLKCRRENPTLVPLCTLRWQGLQRGICLRLILAIILSNESSFAFIPLICFRWCISTFFMLPQLAQHCPKAVRECIFQSLISIGSLYSLVPRKFIVFFTRRGQTKFNTTEVPSRLTIVRLIVGPYRSKHSRDPMSSFFWMVLWRQYRRRK